MSNLYDTFGWKTLRDSGFLAFAMLPAINRPAEPRGHRMRHYTQASFGV